MKALRAVLAVAVVAVAVIVLAGVGQGSAPPTPSLAGAQLTAEPQRVAAAGPLAAEGEREFSEEGCSDCHTIGVGSYHGRLGPRLDVTLQGDDPKDIRGDIVDPNADIASGYPANLMPQDYARRLSPHELDALVAYIHAAAGSGR